MDFGRAMPRSSRQAHRRRRRDRQLGGRRAPIQLDPNLRRSHDARDRRASRSSCCTTPGETPDHSDPWIPQYTAAAFVGDNFCTIRSPNIYTLRGTRPRWALDYVQSLDKVLALEPELLPPSHWQPTRAAMRFASG